MAKKKEPEKIDMSKEELDALQDRIIKKQLNDEDYGIFEKMIHFSIWITIELQNARISIRKLQEMVFGPKTEKSTASKNKEDPTPKDPVDSKPDAIVPEQETPSEESRPAANEDNINDNLNTSNQPTEKGTGHGKKPATDYEPDEVIVVSHDTLKAGDHCPSNCGGRLYPLPTTPGGIIRIQGQSCAHVVSFLFEKLRCALCGAIFTPPKPDNFSDEKYDERFKAIMAVQKYSLSVPFYRQERYLNMTGLDLADATQWDLVESVANIVYPVLGALESIAANYTNINNDDTTTRILSVIKDNKLNPDKERTGMYTTCILATELNKPTICLYYTSAKHSGENVGNLLKKRDTTLPPIMQMCDALSANVSKEFKVILCNCLVHGRRNFVKIDTEIPAEAHHVVTEIGKVYLHEDQAKKAGLSPEERLAHHQKESGPVMEALSLWMQKQFDEKNVEPNSGLGKAIRYMQRHWEKLNRFLTVAGAHLDNNIVEQTLKFVIQLRKNSLFHKSEHGAYVAALFCTLIKTCCLSKINPIDYLTVLQKHKAAIFKSPELWLPWNYQTTLEEIDKIPIKKVV